jgi:hypothetical protein
MSWSISAVQILGPDLVARGLLSVFFGEAAASYGSLLTGDLEVEEEVTFGIVLES